MRKSNWRIAKKSMIKTVAAALALTVGVFVYFRRMTGEFRFADACFMAGLFFCCLGLFRLVRVLGLFDLPIYGFKKLYATVRSKFNDGAEKPYGDYADYLQSVSYDASVTEPLLTGAVLVAVSLAFTLP